MDASELQRLIELMNENDLLEIELEEEGKKVRLKKKPPAPERENPPFLMAQPAAMPMSMPMPMAMPQGAPAAPAGAGDKAAGDAGDSDTFTINSPMVGTFYRAASPDADDFVNVDDEVNAESVVCIIEAMKVMNEIKAEVSGTIAEILVQNGEPVEFGQPLFVVRPL